MAITRVQGNARGAGTGTSFTVTLSSTPIEGNVLILVYGSRSKVSIVPISSVSQTGVTWSKQVAKTDGNNGDAEIWLGVVGSGASTTITVSQGSPFYGGVADVCEYSGILTSLFLDRTATNSGASSNTNTGTTLDTTQANELWIGTTRGVATAQTSATNGFTLLDGAIYSSISVAYLEKIVSSTGTANSGTSPSQTYWVGCIATFKAAGGATNKSFSDVGGGSDEFLNPYRAMPFAETGHGSEAFGIPFKALPFADVCQGVDAFNTPFRAMGFSDVGNGADIFALLRALVSRGPVESLGGVTDAPVARVTRVIAIGEGPINVQDAILINLKKNIAASETILFSESVATQTTRVKAVTEPSLTVSDAVSESVRRSIALSEPNIVFSELVTHSIQRSIAASELIIVADSVSTTVNRNIEVLESITMFDSASINLIRSVVLAEIDIFVNDLATALALITTKTFDVDVSEPPIMFSDSVDVHDSKNIDILEDLGLISDSPIAEVLRDGILQHQNLIVSLLQYFDSHSIVGLTRDRRIIAKANYKQTVGNGMVPLTVRIPDLKYIENILHVQVEIVPDPTEFFGPFWKKIDGNVVGMSIYQVTGVTVCTEVIAVGPP